MAAPGPRGSRSEHHLELPASGSPEPQDLAAHERAAARHPPARDDFHDGRRRQLLALAEESLENHGVRGQAENSRKAAPLARDEIRPGQETVASAVLLEQPLGEPI